MVLDESKSCICDQCQLVLSSKTKLFKHLEDVHGIENQNNIKPCKCVLLVGWLASQSKEVKDFRTYTSISFNNETNTSKCKTLH